MVEKQMGLHVSTVRVLGVTHHGLSGSNRVALVVAVSSKARVQWLLLAADRGEVSMQGVSCQYC